MLAFTYRVGQCHGFSPCFIQPVDVDVAVHVGGRQEISRPVFIDKQGLVSGIIPKGRSMVPISIPPFGVICARKILAAVYPPWSS